MKGPEAVAKAIAENPPTEPDAAILTAWVVVSTWMTPSGTRWITRMDGDANCEQLPSWIRSGLLHEALSDNGFEED